MSITETEILRSIVPKAKVDSITFENSSEGADKLDITINYSIFDIVGRDLVGQWFNNKDYEKYFLINETFIWRYSDNPASQNIIFRTRKTSELTADSETNIESAEGSEIKKFNFTTKKTIDLGSRSLFAMKFRIRTKFDIESLEQDLDIDLFNIFDNRNSSSSDYDGDGQMDKLANIEEVVIMNNGLTFYPVRDFRIKSASKRNLIQDTRVISEYQQRIDEQMVQIEKQKEINNEYLSDLWITRSSRGVSRFLFIFDPSSYFLNNSNFRNFYKKMSNFDKREVIRLLEIPSLKILRKRVLKTEPSSEVIPYSDRSTERVVVETAKKKNSSIFSQVSTDFGRIRQIDISNSGVSHDLGISSPSVQNINQLPGSFSSSDLYFLTGDDAEVAFLGEGDYAYGVSITIADNIRDFLIEKVKYLRDCVSYLNGVVESIYGSNNYDAVNNVYLVDGPSEILEENIYLKMKEVIEKYYKALSLFGPEDINSSVISNFLSIFSEESEQPLDPESIKILSESIQILIDSALSSMGESEITAFKEFAVGQGPSDSKNIPRDYVTIERYYERPENIFSSVVNKRCYFDYLSNFSENIDPNILAEINSLSADQDLIGLRVIDGVQFDRRMETELSRYFSSAEGSLPRTNSFQDPGVSITGIGSEYILPAGIDLGQGVLEILDNLAELYTPKEGTFSETQEHILMASHNVTLNTSPANESPRTLLYVHEGLDDFAIFQSFPPPTAPSRNPESDPVVVDASEREKEAESEKYLFSKIRRLMGLPDLNRQERLFSSANFSSEDLEYTNLQVSNDQRVFDISPNIVRAAVRPGTALVRENMLNGEAKLYSQLLTKIEYLHGFKNSFFQSSVLAPVWLPMTLDDYRANTNRSLLCRIKPASLSELGIRTASTGVPIYDSYFVIKPVGRYTIATPNITTEGLNDSRREETLQSIETMMSYYSSRLAEARASLAELIQQSLEFAMVAQRNMNTYIEHTAIPEANRNDFTATVITDSLAMYYTAYRQANVVASRVNQAIKEMQTYERALGNLGAPAAELDTEPSGY